MSWRDSLRPASYRGIPFYVRESEATGGRKFVQHNYPYINRLITEDTGSKARKYQVNAFVIGDDYIQQKKDLIKSLDTEAGAGTLIHPLYGTLRVIPGEWKVKETQEKGRMAEFEIDFEEFYEEEPQVDPSDSLLGEELSDKYFGLATGSFQFLLDGSLLLAESALQTVTNASEGLVKDLAQLSTKNPRLSAVASQLSRIRRAGVRILRTPEIIANSYRAALFELTTAVSPRRSVDFLKKYIAYSQFIPVIKPISRVSEVESRNNKSVAKIIEKTALGQAIKVLSSTTFPNELKPLLKEVTIESINNELATASDAEYPVLFSAKTLAMKFPRPLDSKVPVNIPISESYLSITKLYQQTGNIQTDLLFESTSNIRDLQP